MIKMKMRSIRVEEFNYCILCGSKGILLYEDIEDRIFNVEGIYNYFICHWCKLAWLNPRPVKEDIPLCYKNYYTHTDDKFSSHNLEYSRAVHIKKIKEKLRLAILHSYYGIPTHKLSKIELISGKILSIIPFIRNRAKYSNPIMPKWHGKGKLLDIGCGDGSFLFNMQKIGWKPYGIEIDQAAANYAINNYNLSVFIGTIEEADFPNGFFDVITMNHTIEHVFDPLSLLEQCYKKLAPGGYIYIATPNLESLAHKIFKKNCFFLDAPRHLWIWSKESLKKAAVNKKFKIIKCETTNYYAATIYDQSKLIKKQGRAALNKKISFAGKLFSKIEYIVNIFKNDISEDIYLILRK